MMPLRCSCVTLSMKSGCSSRIALSSKVASSEGKTMTLAIDDRPSGRQRQQPEKSFTVAEFFAGIGLVRLGLEPEWQVTFANDIDEQKFEMYEENFGKEHFRLDDIHKLKGRH